MIKKIDGPKPWEARGWENGKQYRRRFRTKKAAEQFELEVSKREERRRNGLPQERGPITYGELAQRYIGQSQVERLDWLEDMVAHSVRAFGEVLVRNLLPDEIAIWVARLAVGQETKRKALRQMRAILDRGVAWGFLLQNPARAELVAMPSAPAPKILPFETWDEVFAIAKACGRHESAVVFACGTGLRPGEWLALRWADLDLGGETCRVTRTFVRGALKPTAKTDGSLRTVRLQGLVLDLLRSMPRPINREALVFPNTSGGFLNLHNFGQRTWRKGLTSIGIEHRPVKECRHTFASLALAAGADIYWVSRQLGHTNISTTLRYYARFLPPVDERNITLLNDFSRDARVSYLGQPHAGAL
jgi:integrase